MHAQNPNQNFENKQMNVAKDSKVRPFYEKAPFFIDFRIYLFNVTNKNDVIKGSELPLNWIQRFFPLSCRKIIKFDEIFLQIKAVVLPYVQPISTYEPVMRTLMTFFIHFHSFFLRKTKTRRDRALFLWVRLMQFIFLCYFFTFPS